LARIKKKNTDPVSDIVQSISYGTGLLCAKVSNLGKVAAQNKEWNEVVSTTQGIVKTAGDSVKNSISELKESFDEGVKSIVDEANESRPPKSRAAKEEDDKIQDVEVIIKEEKTETVTEQEVVVHQADIQEGITETPPVVPLPDELEGAPIEDHDEELMDEEEKPKEKALNPKSKKKTAKVVFVQSEPVVRNSSEFTIAEFKKDGKDPKGLIGSIRRNKPEISLASADPLEWLNELLATGDNGQPLKYDIQETPEIAGAKEVFEKAEGAGKTQALIRLNRLILEQAYPLKCPKIPAEEESKSTHRRPKDEDSGINLN